MPEPPSFLNWSVQAPIDPRHAVERNLPGDVYYARVYDPRKPEALDQPLAMILGRWVLECVRPGEVLYAVPLLPHISDRKLRRLLDARLREVATVGVGRDVIIACRNPETIATVLLDFHSERTVFMVAPDSRLVTETLEFLDRYPGEYSTFEVPLMDRLPVHGGFIFASDAHASLEVLGTKHFVIERCVRELLAGPLTSSDLEA